MNSNHVALSKICIAADQLILQSQHASSAAATWPGVDFQHRKKNTNRSPSGEKGSVNCGVLQSQIREHGVREGEKKTVSIQKRKRTIIRSC